MRTAPRDGKARRRKADPAFQIVVDRSGTPWSVPHLSRTQLSALVVKKYDELRLEVSFWWGNGNCSVELFDPGRWDPHRVVRVAAYRWVRSIKPAPTRAERVVHELLARKVASFWASDKALTDWIRPMEEADALATVMRS